MLQVAGGGAAALVALAGCYPTPVDPPGITPSEAPFTRTPYLQAVHDGRATVMWQTTGDVSTSLDYRAGEGGWRSAAVTSRADGTHRVTLGGLGPATGVEYRVRAGDTELGPFGFRTAPADGTTAAARVLAFGDSGYGSTAQLDLARRMRDREWDLSIHVGDIAYPDGSEEDLTLRHFQVYAPLFARVPFFPVPGNHDLHTRGGEPYERAFRWPDGEPGGRHYTFRWGRTQFVALNTASDSVIELLEDREGEQYRWLASTLDSVSRDPTLAWTVVYSHYPIYSHASGFAGHGAHEELREALEPLYLEHGVDLVLAGHDHHYERTHPLRDGRVVADGCAPVYVVTGGGGAARFARSITPDEQTARVSRDYHFLALRVDAGTIMGEAVGRDGRAFDHFEVRPFTPGEGGTCER